MIQAPDNPYLQLGQSGTFQKAGEGINSAIQSYVNFKKESAIRTQEGYRDTELRDNQTKWNKQGVFSPTTNDIGTTTYKNITAAYNVYTGNLENSSARNSAEELLMEQLGVDKANLPKALSGVIKDIAQNVDKGGFIRDAQNIYRRYANLPSTAVGQGMLMPIQKQFEIEEKRTFSNMQQANELRSKEDIAGDKIFSKEKLAGLKADIDAGIATLVNGGFNTNIDYTSAKSISNGIASVKNFVSQNEGYAGAGNKAIKDLSQFKDNLSRSKSSGRSGGSKADLTRINNEIGSKIKRMIGKAKNNNTPNTIMVSIADENGEEQEIDIFMGEDFSKLSTRKKAESIAARLIEDGISIYKDKNMTPENFNRFGEWSLSLGDTSVLKNVGADKGSTAADANKTKLIDKAMSEAKRLDYINKSDIKNLGNSVVPFLKWFKATFDLEGDKVKGERKALEKQAMAIKDKTDKLSKAKYDLIKKYLNANPISTEPNTNSTNPKKPKIKRLK